MACIGICLNDFNELKIILPTCDVMGACELFLFSISCLTNDSGLDINVV